jgi:DSF synthase
MHSSQELHRMGIVDVLVPKGEGEAAVQELIREQQRAPHAHVALNAVRAIAQPVGYDELMSITEVWVDTALALGERSLRTMERIVRAQNRRAGIASAA